MAFTLQEYIENLQELITENPDLADAEVWTANDDEGNGYQSLTLLPYVLLTVKTIILLNISTTSIMLLKN